MTASSATTWTNAAIADVARARPAAHPRHRSPTARAEAVLSGREPHPRSSLAPGPPARASRLAAVREGHWLTPQSVPQSRGAVSRQALCDGLRCKRECRRSLPARLRRTMTRSPPNLWVDGSFRCERHVGCRRKRALRGEEVRRATGPDEHPGVCQSPSAICLPRCRAPLGLRLLARGECLPTRRTRRARLLPPGDNQHCRPVVPPLVRATVWSTSAATRRCGGTRGRPGPPSEGLLSAARTRWRGRKTQGNRGQGWKPDTGQQARNWRPPQA
jgi:hypothetical protein